MEHERLRQPVLLCSSVFGVVGGIHLWGIASDLPRQITFQWNANNITALTLLFVVFATISHLVVAVWQSRTERRNRAE